MENRVISVFTVFSLIIGCLCLRLYVVCSKGTEYVSSGSHGYVINIGDIRGDIYDCNAVKLTNTEYDNIVVAKPTLKALDALENVLDTESFANVKAKMEKSNAVSINIGKLEIEQNSDAITLKSYKRYSENQLAQHIVGYINSDGNGVSGIECCFEDILYTGKKLSARFSSGADGKIISGDKIDIINSELKTGSVYLTIDSDIQRATENSLVMCDVNQGGAVVLDAESGAIRAIASRPSYNAYNIKASLKDENSPLVNRTLQSYAVGSIFKVAVAAAAIESGINDFEFECTGSCKVGEVTFHCNKSTVHGSLNMQKALECSCNTYFIKLAQKIGAKKLLETATAMGFGQDIKLADTMIAKAGVIPTAESLKNLGSLANFSFGQGGFTASMLQIGEMISSVSSGGKYITPFLVEKVVDSSGKTVYRQKETYPVYAIEKTTANRLSKMLFNVVENGNASKAKLKNNVTAAGKTATAQTGTYDSNGNEICNTWFGGFFPVDNPKYVVIILKQGGSSGAQDCAPVFKKIGDKIYDILKSRNF